MEGTGSPNACPDDLLKCTRPVDVVQEPLREVSWSNEGEWYGLMDFPPSLAKVFLVIEKAIQTRVMTGRQPNLAEALEDQMMMAMQMKRGSSPLCSNPKGG